FYGTANSNQLLMEAMGLHLPGSSLVTPDTPLREALTAAAGARAAPVVRRGLGVEQGLTVDLALGEHLADAGLLSVGQSRGHR
ncbi:dihydroxy-acid dehydratase, partial [Mycolicibacterium smegmatis]